jgi:hypothetical protein
MQELCPCCQLVQRFIEASGFAGSPALLSRGRLVHLIHQLCFLLGNEDWYKGLSNWVGDWSIAEEEKGEAALIDQPGSFFK